MRHNEARVASHTKPNESHVFIDTSRFIFLQYQPVVGFESVSLFLLKSNCTKTRTTISEGVRTCVLREREREWKMERERER